VGRDIESGSFGQQVEGRPIINRTFGFIKLDNKNAQSKPLARATMPPRKRKSTTGKKRHVKDGTQIVPLPEIHRYQTRGKKIKNWSKKAVFIEIKTRNKAGTNGQKLSGRHWWSVSKLIRVLLVDDGFNFSYVDTKKSASNITASAGDVTAGDDMRGSGDEAEEWGDILSEDGESGDEESEAEESEGDTRMQDQ